MEDTPQMSVIGYVIFACIALLALPLLPFLLLLGLLAGDRDEEEQPNLSYD